MDLIKVNIVRPQVGKADINILCHSLLRPRHTLGGDDELVPDALQGIAQVFLADGVAPGGINVIHAGIHQCLHQRLGALRVDALDGNAAKAHTGDLQTGLSKNGILNSLTSLTQ